MKKIRFALICLADWCDYHIIGHRWYWLCCKIGTLEWWGGDGETDVINPLLGKLTDDEAKKL